MARSRLFRIRQWQVGTVTVLLWSVLSFGWSGFVIVTAFDHSIAEQMITRAQQTALLLRDGLSASAAAPEDENILRRFVRVSPLQDEVEQVKRLDPHAAYVMLWTRDGMVVVDSRRDMPGQTLGFDKWPALESHQQSRVWKLHNVDVGRATIDVTDATVPLKLGNTTIGYVSIGYSQDRITELFWATQIRMMIFALIFTVLGAVIILILEHIALDRLDRYRREVQQNARARTSLLTERGMLASVLAHEVRSPLTAIRFNLHSLRSLISARSSDADRQVELTDRCEREIRRLDGMLNDFLLRTQVIGQIENTSVNAVIREAIEFLRPALDRVNVRPIIHLDPADPHVRVHPDELRQVLLNLAANAQDAMPKGGTLAVSAIAEEQNVTLLIRDSGTGIPTELRERIFEPFFSTKPNGSGLGLALVRRVVSGAGGTIFCESATGDSTGKAGGGGGTTFRIVLPRGEHAPSGTQAGGGSA